MALSRRPARPRRARLTVHTLEARDVPAGVVKAELVKGLLTLTGDDAGNSLSVIVTGVGAGGGPHVKLVAADNTQITGNLPAGGVDVTDIKAVMKGGNDSLTFGSEFARGGAPGDPDFDFFLPGAATVDLGDGDNTFRAELPGKLSLGDLSVTAADGFDHVVITAREAGSGMATGRRQHSPVRFSLGDGGYDVGIANFTVPGKDGMTFEAGDGNGIFVAAGDLDGDGTAEFARGLQLGDDPAAGQPFTGGGAFTGETGNGICSYSWGVCNQGSWSASGGGGGAGKVSATFTDSIATGDVKLTGATDLELKATSTAVGGSVKVQKKWLPANFRTSATVSLTDCDVTKGVDVSAEGGSSTAKLTLTGGLVGGSVKVTDPGTNGIASLTAHGMDVTGAVEVKATGPGGVAVGDWDGDGFVGSVTLQGAKQASLAVDGSVTVGLFGGPNGSTPGDVTVASTGGDAYLSLSGSGKPTVDADDVSVSGFATTLVSLTKAADLFLGGDLSVTSTQDASLTDFDGDGSVRVDGKVAVKGQDSASVTEPKTWSSSQLSVTSSHGPATVALAGSVALPKGLSVAGGHSVDVSVKPTLAGASPPVIDGKVQVSGGFGGGKVTFQDLHFSSVKVDVKGGGTQVTMKKTFVLPHVLEKSGYLSISTGTGDDSITLDGVTVTGRTDIKTGGGKDTLKIDGSAQDQPPGQQFPFTFGDAFTADLGAGDDQILIAQDPAAKFPVTFAKGVSVLAGAGNDTLKLGVAAGTPGAGQFTKVVFRVSGVKYDGGSGLNLFDDEAGQFTLPPDAVFQKVFPNWTDPT